MKTSAFVPAKIQHHSLLALTRLAANGKLAARARANLAIAFGGELDTAQREAILRANLRHSARIIQECLRLARGAPPEGVHSHRGQWIEGAVSVDPSIEHLKSVLAQGRGAIIVTAHLGNWELGCARVRRLGVRGQVVGLERRRDSSTQLMSAMRAGFGVPTLAQDSSPRAVLEVLRQGQVLGLVCDLEVRRLAGEPIPFFGQPAFTMRAPASLARAHRTPLVPMRCVARGKAYLLSFEAPLAIDPSLGPTQARQDLLLRLNRTFERWIREDPDQWAWTQRRWRTASPEDVG